MDRWEQQTQHKQHKQNSSSSSAWRWLQTEHKRSWGSMEELWPYIAKLDQDSLREVKRRIDAKLAVS